MKIERITYDVKIPDLTVYFEGIDEPFSESEFPHYSSVRNKLEIIRALLDALNDGELFEIKKENNE